MRGLSGILIGLTLVTASCRGASIEASASIPDHTVVFTSAAGERETLQVAVADDDRERATGLMGVPTLPEGQGMAFVFERPTNGSFWMKDTLIPLSIAFVDAGGTIIGIQEMTPCKTEPCPTYGVEGQITLAVEANRGYFASEGIGAGDEATLEEMGNVTGSSAMDGCLLCDAERITEWLHEDEESWAAECVVCRTPMIVWRTHGLPDPALEAVLIERLERIAAERYGDEGFWVDPERRRIPDHWHAHARPAGEFFDPKSALYVRDHGDTPS